MFATKRVLRNHYDALRSHVYAYENKIIPIIQEWFKYHKVDSLSPGTIRISHDPIIDVIFNTPFRVNWRATFVFKEQCPLFWSNETRRAHLKNDINTYFEEKNKTSASHVRVKYLTATDVALTLSNSIKVKGR